MPCKEKGHLIRQLVYKPLDKVLKIRKAQSKYAIQFPLIGFRVLLQFFSSETLKLGKKGRKKIEEGNRVRYINNDHNGKNGIIIIKKH